MEPNKEIDNVGFRPSTQPTIVLNNYPCEGRNRGQFMPLFYIIFIIKKRRFNYQLSTVNCQLPTVNYQLSTINCQLSTVNYQLSTSKTHINPLDLSIFSRRLRAISCKSIILSVSSTISPVSTSNTSSKVTTPDTLPYSSSTTTKCSRLS